MKHRAIKDLSQLNEKSLLKEVSEGLNAIYESCIGLDQSARTLKENEDVRGSKIIEAIAKEEAAKYLILLDALRCPRNNHELFSRQLAKFNEHLAKGIYSDVCGLNFNDYKNLSDHIKTELKEYYLDGPMDVDFIYRNRIIASREQSFYVDYVEYDEEHHWLSPHNDSFLSLLSDSPLIIKLVKALHNIGVYEIKALKIFSEFWRKFEFKNETNYQDFKKENMAFLEFLETNNSLSHNYKKNDLLLIVKYLPFPLYKEKMKEIKVDKKLLKEIQENWSPDYYDQQGGF